LNQIQVIRCLLTGLTLLGAPGCGQASPDSETGGCPHQQAIIDGTRESPLSRGVERAVGAMRPRGGDLCTVVHVGDGFLLTAAHCVANELEPAQVEVEFGPVVFSGDECAAPLQITPQSIARHPELDVALLRLEASDVSLLAEDRVELSGGATGASDGVWIAGFGIDEEGISGVRRFAESSVGEVSGTTITVESEHERGACLGDSGGPLFVNEEGEWNLAGVLSRGSASCTGEDEYVRLDVAEMSDWIETEMGF